MVSDLAVVFDTQRVLATTFQRRRDGTLALGLTLASLTGENSQFVTLQNTNADGRDLAKLLRARTVLSP